MNHPLARILLAAVCCLVARPAAAQTWRPSGDDGDAPHPSHIPLNGGVSDLAGAEDLLARRLHHTHDIQEIQDLVKPLLDNDDFKSMLKDKIKNLNDDDIQSLKETIRKNPQLLDDPKLRDMLKGAEKFKQDGDLDKLPAETKDSVLKLAKDIIDKQKAAGDPTTGGPTGQGPQTGVQQLPPPPPVLSHAPLAPDASQPDWVTHNLAQGMAGLIKDIDRTPEGEALRTAALRELAKMESDSSASSSGFANFLKGILSSDQASWLANAGKNSSGTDLGGWNLGGGASAAPSFGGSSDGLADGVVWVVVLALLIAAGWMAVAVARRRAGARMRARPWSAGPWPVRPSQVSTRQDLIRAFEHLAYLFLGLSARNLNHLDVAARLDRNDGHAGAAGRLARLYEQARYAPPDEVMPDREITAARGDLLVLAGAAA